LATDAGLPFAEQSEALGIIAKLRNPSFSDCEERLSSKLEINRAERYRLKNTSARVLRNKRIKYCGLRRISPQVDIHRDGSFTGVEHCSDIRGCPICNARITERRRFELKQALDAAERLGWKPYLFTLTYPHSTQDDLQALVDSFLGNEHKSGARRLFRNRKVWKNFAKTVGLQGIVYCLEATRGQNGWHVHTHEILFLSINDPEKAGSIADWEAVLLPAWQKACVDAGLKTPNSHGLQIQSANAISDYLSNWSVDYELTKANSKKGKADSRTPWDMLRDFQETGDCQSADLFREFHRVFRGRHQLVYSKGLRQKLGLQKEKSDCELNEESNEKSPVVCSIDAERWMKVAQLSLSSNPSSYPVQYFISLFARRGDSAETILQFIDSLPNPPPRVFRE
jgi:hypothetical protein